MDFLSALWIPILVSGILVWIASFLIWMVSPMHKGEWKKLSDEKGFMGALTEMGVQPGQYMFPCAEDGKQMKDPEFCEMAKRGPSGTLIVWPGMPNMGKNMALTLIVYWIIGVFVAYLCAHTLNGSEPYLAKFRVAGTAAVMAYVFASIPHDIWFGRSGKSIMTGIVDGVIYGLLTAGTFGWLWHANIAVTVPAS